MQAAQWGYLHATPGEYKQTRLQMFGGVPQGIEAVEGSYLLDALQEVGWEVCQSQAPWTELINYAAGTWAVSEPWEYRAIMAMSRAYVRAINEGKDVHCIPPVEREADD